MVREVTGRVAEIKWSYYTAATLRDYALTRTDDGWHMSAVVVSSDAMRVSQQPLACVVPGTSWRFPVLSLQITGASLSATLGPCEG